MRDVEQERCRCDLKMEEGGTLVRLMQVSLPVDEHSTAVPTFDLVEYELLVDPLAL